MIREKVERNCTNSKCKRSKSVQERHEREAVRYIMGLECRYICSTIQVNKVLQRGVMSVLCKVQTAKSINTLRAGDADLRF